jgi:hypothetical protein
VLHRYTNDNESDCCLFSGDRMLVLFWLPILLSMRISI